MPGGSRGSDERTLPWYGWVGMASLLAGKAGLFLDVAPIPMFFYGIAWWSYILLVDACAWRRCGASLLRSRPWEFWFLAFWSVPLWNLFELLNFRLQNWFYVNTPADQPLALLFNFISYATVLPALFETYLLLDAYGVANGIRMRPRRIASVGLAGSVILGLGMLIAPLVWPRVAFPLIWGFAIFLGEPLCYWASPRTVSLARQLERGDPRPFLRLLLAGFVCGGLWEFWNFWAYTKWLYTVPHLEDLKWFEMPPLGFLGFPAFAVDVLCARQSAERHPPGTKLGNLGLGRSRHTARHRRPRHRAGAGVQRLHVCGHRPMDGQERRADAGGDGGGARGCRGATGAIRREARRRRCSGIPTRRSASRSSLRQSQVPEGELQTLRAAAALVDLQGLGAVNYNALRRLDIATVEELAQCVPPLLLPRWRAAVAERPPSASQVTLWIRAARRQTRSAPPPPSAFAGGDYGSVTSN